LLSEIEDCERGLMDDRTGPLEKMMLVGDSLPAIAARLKTDSPGQDAQLLLAEVLNRSRTWLAAHAEAALTPAELESVEGAVARLEAGEPLPYVIGHWEFFGLDFGLTPDVLIPRPETELLVEKAIAFLRAASGRLTVADVGTGSGAIGIAIARHVPTSHIVATDISAPALEIAKQNALKHKLADRIEYIHCDLLPPDHETRFDLICANLPYIPTHTLQNLRVYRREPTIALDGGADGLDLIRRLLGKSTEHLARGGVMMLEIESTQGAMAVSLAQSAFPAARIVLHKDLADHDRLLDIALL
jgi:release factor glutamine methyltransferase